MNPFTFLLLQAIGTEYLRAFGIPVQHTSGIVVDLVNSQRTPKKDNAQ